MHHPSQTSACHCTACLSYILHQQLAHTPGTAHVPCVLLRAHRAIAVTATDAAGKPVKVLCPGVEHTVTVKYPEARRTLLTTTQGAWATANATCVGRMYTPKGGKAAESFKAVLTIPCNTTGEADSPAGCCRHTSRRTQCCWRITPWAAGRDELRTQTVGGCHHLSPYVRACAARCCAACLLPVQPPAPSSK